METKAHFTVSVSKDVLTNFYDIACKKSINKSLLIENFLKDWIFENAINESDKEMVCSSYYINHYSSVKTDH